ncbi:hypothetical protein BHE74_00005681, partial [Ensete ventricosum]
EAREREREREACGCVFGFPFNPNKQHGNLCCTSMAALGCVQDNESITHHTESREEGVPFPSNFRQLHTYMCIYISLAPPQQNPFLHHLLQSATPTMASAQHKTLPACPQ